MSENDADPARLARTCCCGCLRQKSGSRISWVRLVICSHGRIQHLVPCHMRAATYVGFGVFDVQHGLDTRFLLFFFLLGDVYRRRLS